MEGKKYLAIAEPCLGAEEWQALKEPLESGWLTQGPKVRQFETAFGQRHQARHALAVTSCTTALHLALLSLQVGPGDTVALPSFTWVASANAVEYCGARPIFCDSRPDTYNIDPAKLEELLETLRPAGRLPKAVMAVHLFGQAADLEALGRLADRYGFQIIEDAACAAGADYQGRPVGTYGAVGCFSFHPRKIISTGEGGMCLTNHDQLAERMAVMRSHGASRSEEQRHHGDRPFLLPDFNVLGFNYRLTDLQGALGLVQLSKLDDFISGRRRLAAIYDRELEDIDWLARPAVGPGVGHSYQAYVTQVTGRFKDRRDAVMQDLHRQGIASRAGTQAVHELGYYRSKYGPDYARCPVASQLAARTLALPLHNKMTDDDCRRVAAALRAMG